MPSFRLLLPAALCLALFSRPKPRSEWPGGRPEVDTLKLRDGVVAVPKALTNAAKVTKTGLSFPASMAADVAMKWPAGSVIVGSPAEDLEARRTNPFGFMRKVTGSHLEGDQVIVDTGPALITDVVTGDLHKGLALDTAPEVQLPPGTDLTDYNVQINLTTGAAFPLGLGYDGDGGTDSTQQPLVDPAHLVPLFHENGVAHQALNATGPTFSVPQVPLDFIDLDEHLNVPGSTTTGLDLVGVAKVTPVLDFTPTVIIDYSAGLFSGLTDFQFSVEGNLNFGADYELAYQVNPRGPITLPQLNLLLGSLPASPLHKANLKPIGAPRMVSGSVGPIPVVLVTGAYLDCQTTFTGQMGLKGGLRANVSPKAGMVWKKHHGWDTIAEFPIVPPTVTGDLLVAGAAGPYAQIRNDLIPHAEYSEACPPVATDTALKSHAGDANIDVGIKGYSALQVGIEIKLLDIITLETGPYDVLRKNYLTGPEHLVDNPDYVAGCDLWFCPPRQITQSDWLDIKHWTFTKPGAARGTPDAGTWCVVPCDDGQKNGSETDVDCAARAASAPATRPARSTVTACRAPARATRSARGPSAKTA